MEPYRTWGRIKRMHLGDDGKYKLSSFTEGNARVLNGCEQNPSHFHVSFLGAHRSIWIPWCSPRAEGIDEHKINVNSQRSRVRVPAGPNPWSNELLALSTRGISMK